MVVCGYRHLRITNEILGVGLAVFRFCCVGAPRAVRKKSGQWLR